MGWVPWLLALSIVAATNYWASRARRLATGTRVLLITSLPAVALIGYAGVRLAWAIVDAEEVNRRFQEGDLTYFGADMAFVISLLIGALWMLMAYAGFRLGRWNRRPE